MRRARGYIPFSIDVSEQIFSSPDLFAGGSQQKNTFAFFKKNTIYMGQHIGDLESAAACRAYDDEAGKWRRLLDVEPAARSRG